MNIDNIIVPAGYSKEDAQKSIERLLKFKRGHTTNIINLYKDIQQLTTVANSCHATLEDILKVHGKQKAFDAAVEAYYKTIADLAIFGVKDD